MKNLIIYDGIWGSGKTTLMNKVKGTPDSYFIFDNEEEHPLFNTSEMDFESFFQYYISKIQKLKNQTDKKVIYTESLILNGLVLDAVSKNISEKILFEKIKSLEGAFEGLNVELYFLYPKSIEETFLNTKKVRGDEWVSTICQEFKFSEHEIVPFLGNLLKFQILVFDKLSYVKHQIEI